MAKLALSIAVGDYDRVRPLVDGSVQIDGVDPVFMLLEPEEIFFRAFRHADFDMCELSMSSFTVKTANVRILTLTLPEQAIGVSAVSQVMASALHESQYSRLFRS